MNGVDCGYRYVNDWVQAYMIFSGKIITDHFLWTLFVTLVVNSWSLLPVGVTYTQIACLLLVACSSLTLAKLSVWMLKITLGWPDTLGFSESSNSLVPFTIGTDDSNS
jgi:hypothetical protein